MKSLQTFKGILVYESIKRQDRCYYIRYKNQYGRAIIEKIGWASEGITPQQAQLVRNERIKAVRLGDEVISIQQKRKTSTPFHLFFNDYYLPNCTTKSKKSVELEKMLFRVWINPIIGNKAMKDISPFDLERIKKYMRDSGKSNRTINYALTVVRQVFNKAIAWDMFKGVNPISKVKMEKLNNKRLRFLTTNEARALLDELKKHSNQTYQISAFSLFTGMRAGEIFNLKFGDVDFKNGLIHIKNPKNNEDRVAYITIEVEAILKDKKGKPNEYVFKNTKGRKITEVPKTFERTVKRLGLNNGIEDRKDKVVFHTLRHTFASWLAMKGVPIYTISKLMGHKDISMTQRYSHLSPDTKRTAVETISGMLNNNVIKMKQKQ